MENSKQILGLGEYAVAENQQFIDRTGQLVRPVKGKGLVPVGEAYAFFYCEASKDEIKMTLPGIRELTQTPSELELYLYKGNEIAEKTEHDSELVKMANQAKESGTNILMHGYYPTKTNKETADELATVLNQVYQSPLYESEEEIIGGIIYKQDEQYVFRD